MSKTKKRFWVVSDRDSRCSYNTIGW